MGSQWIEHQGKRILYQDYHGENEEQMIETLVQAGELAAASPTPVLSLSNMENAVVTNLFFRQSKAIGNEIFNQKVVKSAIIGITGLLPIFVSSYTQLMNISHLRVCSTQEEALDWLVSDNP